MVEDSGAFFVQRRRRHRAAFIVVAFVAAAFALASCGATGRAVGASVGVGHPAALSEAPGAAQAYSAKSFRVVVVRVTEGGPPEPLSGEDVVIWDSSALARIERTTAEDGTASFVCRCSPEVFVDGGEALSPQPDDVLPSHFSILVEVR